jgi:hypothetical protein
LNNQTDNKKSNQNNLKTSPTQDQIGNGSISLETNYDQKPQNAAQEVKDKEKDIASVTI